MAQMPTSFAGLSLDKSCIMGVINVTPDSFSDAGEVFTQEKAADRGWAMVQAGANILDIGGESTRPGAQEISISEELDRIIPVIESLREASVVISVDTRHAEVMDAAIKAGAHIINDVTSLTGGPKSLEVAAELRCPVVLMHMQGDPKIMQNKPKYDDAPSEVSAYLLGRIEACRGAGIERSQIAIDPGIGFGKSVKHNLQILNQIDCLHEHGCAIVLGVSRKSFIGAITNTKHPQDRLPGSLAAVIYARAKGVQIFRVHDVSETKQALDIFDHIQSI
jgi:dihydropteroate synthase